MKRLSEKEEMIMRLIWEKGHAFVKDVKDHLAAPQPHINTVATVMRRLADKKFLRYEEMGGSLLYSPVVSSQEYNATVVKPLLKGLFGNSLKNAVAFFAQEEDITVADLKEILDMIQKDKD